MFMQIIRRRALVSIGMLVLAALVGFVGTQVFQTSQAESAFAKDGLLRLHILANSNHPVDQDLKLVVRDAVLAATQEIFSGVATKDQATIYIMDHWKTIQDTAHTTIQEHGLDYTVQLQLGNFEFPNREYGALSLPAGDYEEHNV